MQRAGSAALLIWCIAIAGCQAIGSARQAMIGLAAVEKAVSEHADGYPSSVFVSNGSYITISIPNSPLHDLPPSEKQAKTLEIARAAYQAYPDRADLTAVAIVLSVDKTYLLFFHSSDLRDQHEFKAEELRQSTPLNTPGPSAPSKSG